MALAGLVDEAELDQLARRVDEWHADPGEELVREGHPAPQAFVIAEGNAVVRVGGRQVARLAAGSCIWADGLHGEPQPANVVAETAMWLFVLAPADQHMLLGKAAP
jgi:CRP-like cAMP-binding protein